MSRLWVKVWTDSLGDVKVSRLPDHLWRRFYELIMLAGIRDEGGLLPSMDDMCWLLHTDANNLLDDLIALQSRGLVGPANEYDWIVVNWLKRQETAEAVRQRRYRERQKASTPVVTSDVTDNVIPARNNSTSTSTSTSTSLINNKESYAEIVKLYESEIGMITPRMSEVLAMTAEEYPLEWIRKAVEISAENNVRKWSYVTAILERWKVHGFQSSNGRKGKGDEPKVYIGSDQGDEDIVSESVTKPDTPASLVWDRVLMAIQSDVPLSFYRQHIATLIPDRMDDEHLWLVARDEHHRNLVISRVDTTIKRLLVGITNHEVEVVYEVQS